jgi:hypothetical protein
MRAALEPAAYPGAAGGTMSVHAGAGPAQRRGTELREAARAGAKNR